MADAEKSLGVGSDFSCRPPSVSAILPAFNSARFISRAIGSVLSQEGANVAELIIVDDCSSDGTLDVVRAHFGADQRIKFLSTQRNSGPGPARNLGISAATGEWIALIDADDAWERCRLSRLLDETVEGADLIFDNLMGYDQKAGAESGVIFPMMPESMSVVDMAAEHAPHTKFNYGYLKPLIRRSFLERSGVVYSDIRISEDLLFYLELLITGARTKVSASAYYIYTTALGLLSGRRSADSTSIAGDLPVAALLDELASKYAGRLGVLEMDAIRKRASHLRQAAPLNRLYESWTRGRYLSFAWQCIADPRARRALSRKLRGRSAEI